MGSIVEASTTSVGRQQPVLPHVAITCVGTLEITCVGRPMITWPNQKARELLVYLATCENGQATRQAVQAALWPRVMERWAAQGLLRTALWHVRRLLDRGGALPVRDTNSSIDSVVMRKGNLLLLNPMRCTTDYAELYARRAALLRSEASAFETNRDAPDGMSAGNLARHWLAIADACARPICAGESFTWLDVLNRRQQEWRLDAVTQAHRFAECAGESALMAHVLESRLQCDPLHEPTLVALLRLRHAQGETAEVATRYRTFRDELARHVAITSGIPPLPSAEVESLFLAALAGGSPSPIAEATTDASKQHHQSIPPLDLTISECPSPARAPPEQA